MTPRADGRHAHCMPAREIVRVLIVDDDRSLRASLERALAERFPEVRSAASVAEAIAAVRDFGPDLLLLDVELPDGSAHDVLQSLWSDISPKFLFLELLH